MRAVVQRVKEAKVAVDHQIVGEIKHGYLVYLGVTHTDTIETAKKIAEKILKLRVFEDDDGKLNLNIHQVKGALLVVSQFTLYGDVKGNNRPSFIEAARPEMANALYDYFVEVLKASCHVETGVFQSHMDVSSVNDGPVTIFIEY